MALEECRGHGCSEFNRGRVLVVCPDADCAQPVCKALFSQDQLEIQRVCEKAEVLRLVSTWRPQLVLLDLATPAVEGFDLLHQIQTGDPDVDVILLSGDYSTESAVEAIQRGAFDYLTKPISPAKLLERVERWLKSALDRRRGDAPEAELVETLQLDGIVGRSPAMLDVFSKVRRVAPHFRTVLVSGATGTGKEMIARALHTLSGRPKGAFVVCNAAALPDTLVESELFGHRRGAFTGAHQDKTGLVEAAHGGTLFLDEIGDIPGATQSKLLRVLQNREVQRLGSAATIAVDVRVVAATNRDLRSMAASGEFREDLYYRLASAEIRLPSLAERREDIPLLERHFLQKYRDLYGKPELRFSVAVDALLRRHSWPGNVRQMENAIASACMFAEGYMIQVHHLPDWLKDVHQTNGMADDKLLSLDDVTAKHVTTVLARCGGNRARAAKVLGISRATVYRLLHRSGRGQVPAATIALPSTIN
jgi:DNA-binding NtrC family response regulator